MKLKLSLLLFLAICLSLTAQTKDYPIQPVPFTKVNITNGFWFTRMETNRTVTIPFSIKLLEETGRMKNFLIAAKKDTGDFCSSFYFDDSDAYKVIEAASYSLMLKPDKALEAKLDSMITEIAAAQEPDGYLYTPRTIGTKKFAKTMGDKRWMNEQHSHELYVLGHMYEAAVAHYMATGKRNFLDVALKSAELVCSVFGPGKLQLPSGHQEIEIGLVKLYRLTGDKKYLNLAKFFLDMRGNYLDGRKSWGEYNQDHKPVVKQDEAVGHAVRAAYMYSAMADVAALTGDEKYINAMDKIWENVVSKKIYLTGGIGASGSWEGFANNYELPNASAYNETCASIANIMWNHRMFLLKGDAKYLDVLERTLYNALLSGIGMSGDLFFYPNVLESFGTHERSRWFSCACCPPNVARLIASIAGYAYAVKDDELFVNLFSTNKTEINLKNGSVKLAQQTNYPWDGKINLTIEPGKANQEFVLNIRVPGWAQNKPVPSDLYAFSDKETGSVSLSINGKQIPVEIKDGFASIKRIWNAGDVVELNLPMEARRIAANQNVDADKGKVALQKGPLVYAAEWADNKNGFVRNIFLPDNSKLTALFKPDLLNGVEIIEGDAFGCKINKEKNGIEKFEQHITAIPYYAWAHRGKGEMSVWLAKDESIVRALSDATLLTNSKITVSHGSDVEAMKDQIEPKSSNDESVPFYHWWPSKGQKEFVQIDFAKPEEISQAAAYWFDDTGVGECRIPISWKVFYKEGNEWREVWPTNTKPYGVEKDKNNSVEFETVKTQSVKIEIQSQKDFAGGIHELKIK